MTTTHDAVDLAGDAARNRPVFINSHSHTLSRIVGYDVIRSTMTNPLSDAPHVTLEVMGIIDFPERYSDALAMSKRYHRVEGHYGYVAPRYACGCRFVGVYLTGDHIEFVDYDQQATHIDLCAVHFITDCPDCEK